MQNNRSMKQKRSNGEGGDYSRRKIVKTQRSMLRKIKLRSREAAYA